MEKATIFEKYIIGLVGLVLILLVILNLYQYRQMTKVSGGLTGEQASNSHSYQKQSQGTQEVNDEISEIEYLKGQIAAAREELAMVESEMADEKKRKEKEQRAQDEMLANLRENAVSRYKDPGYKEMMIANLALENADFFKLLNLSPERLDALKDIMADNIVEKKKNLLSLSLQQDGTNNKEEKAEISQRLMESEETYKTKLKEFLGPESYGVYLHYQETRSQRAYVAEFVGSFDMEETIAGAQLEKLIDGLYEAEKQADNYVFNASDVESLAENGPYMSSVDQFDRKMNAYLDVAEEILKPAQYDQFEVYWDKKRDEYVSMMNRMDADIPNRYNTN